MVCPKKEILKTFSVQNLDVALMSGIDAFSPPHLLNVFVLKPLAWTKMLARWTEGDTDPPSSEVNASGAKQAIAA